MKEKFKKAAGAIPFALAALCSLIVGMIESMTGDTLRSAPRMILTCFGVCSLGAFLFWVNTRKKVTARKQIAVWSLRSVSAILFIFAALIGLFDMVFRNPEHIVVMNNTKMVASVHAFLDVSVRYYQYKNALFYGKELGYEYYGSGGYDPFEEPEMPEPVYAKFDDSVGYFDGGQAGDTSADIGRDGETAGDPTQGELNQEAAIKELDIDVLENRTDELVFNFSIADFIDSYNGYYWQDRHVRYLSSLSSDNWSGRLYDSAIHSSHETLYYNFSEDRKIWPLPTISVYVPKNADYVQEITLNFDDHSYTEAMYDRYEEICFYTLKVFFPDMEDEKITALYKTLNQLAYDNMMPHEQRYGSGSIPCALYYKDGIGLYPYFAIGESVRLCIIPVDEKTIRYYEGNGVEIYEIE